MQNKKTERGERTCSSSEGFHPVMLLQNVPHPLDQHGDSVSICRRRTNSCGQQRSLSQRCSLQRSAAVHARMKTQQQKHFSLDLFQERKKKKSNKNKISSICLFLKNVQVKYICRITRPPEKANQKVTDTPLSINVFYNISLSF